MQNKSLHRLLKASISLKVAVFFIILSMTLLMAYIFSAFELSLLLGLILLFPFVLTNITTEIITRIAEKRNTEPNPWFDADIEREKRRYGPLRAKRKFGHTIGKSK